MLDSVFYSVILVIFMTVLALVAVRSRVLRRGAGGNSSSASQRRISWLGTYSQGFQRALDVLSALGAEIAAADPNRGTISARMPASPVSITPFGAVIRVALTTQDGVTFVNVEAVPGLAGTPGASRLLNHFTQVWDRLPAPIKS